jgi:signal transduction histidine kinase
VVTFGLLRERTYPEDFRTTDAYLEQVRAGFDNPDYDMRLRMLDGRTNQPEPSFEKVQQVLKRMVNDARRAADVIDRVRTMASTGAPRQSEIALAEIITECTASLHHEFQSRNVSNSLDLAPDLPNVMADRTQLQQVIVNLVLNAVQAMTTSEAAHRNIAIRTQQIDAETVCCIAEDCGPGMTRSIYRVCSTVSLRPRRRTWAWACRSPARSSKHTMGVFEPTTSRLLAAADLSSNCLQAFL